MLQWLMSKSMHSLCCAFVTKVVHPFASSELRQASKNYNAAKKMLAIVSGFVIFVNIFFSVHTNILESAYIYRL